MNTSFFFFKSLYYDSIVFNFELDFQKVTWNFGLVIVRRWEKQAESKLLVYLRCKTVGEEKNEDEEEKEGKAKESETNRRGKGDESSRLTRHCGRACLISVRRRRCGASAFGSSVLSLHPFSKQPEHPVINNGAFWNLEVTWGWRRW